MIPIFSVPMTQKACLIAWPHGHWCLKTSILRPIIYLPAFFFKSLGLYSARFNLLLDHIRVEFSY